MLKHSYSSGLIEAGCDEAGRGCLAGPVFAAAVILPDTFVNPVLNDSKKLSKNTRDELRKSIEEQSVAWAVASVNHAMIDEINILRASILAMHMALKKLSIKPQLILVDGNRFDRFEEIRNVCIVKGDGIYSSIAAASILAKTHRDEYMENLHLQYPEYKWNSNKGYPTPDHIKSLMKYGQSPFHRRTFHLKGQYLLHV